MQTTGFLVADVQTSSHRCETRPSSDATETTTTTTTTTTAAAAAAATTATATATTTTTWHLFLVASQQRVVRVASVVHLSCGRACHDRVGRHLLCPTQLFYDCSKVLNAYNCRYWQRYWYRKFCISTLPLLPTNLNTDMLHEAKTSRPAPKRSSKRLLGPSKP